MRKLFLFLSFFVSCTLISGQGMAQCIADLCHCDTARSQSPIDINTHSVRSTKKNPFKFSFCDKRQTYHYKLANTTGLIPDSVNTIVYEGATYQLLQVHTHLPGEHTINGVSYDFELHYVFQNTGAGKDFIVIAIYGNIEAGTSPPPATSYQQCTRDALEWIKNGAIAYAGGSTPTPQGTIDPFDYIKSGFLNAYYTYHGSLTAPKCTQNVTWIIGSTPVTVHMAARPFFPPGMVPKYILDNRPIQKLNGRTVECYRKK